MSSSYTHRPTFPGPAAIPLASVTHYLWGEPEAGEVADWVYVSSDKIHMMVFGMPAGGWFRHSKKSRTVFNADEIYYVLEGTLVLCNPETGEVHPLEEGQAAFFRRDTWHHACNYGPGPVRVLEFMAPPPRQGTTQPYARTRPYLSEPRYTQDQWLGRWPMAADEAQASYSMRRLTESDITWRLEGKEQPVLVGLLASTEFLTVGRMRLLPGQKSAVEMHRGDEGVFVLEGKLNVRLPDQPGQSWFELGPEDGFYLPEGTRHQYYNYGDRPVELMFGVAPTYLGLEQAEK
jgi:mannose-6-phosphate isomerase-like protein (cupin superfamily)